jgi:hypothetical protein
VSWTRHARTALLAAYDAALDEGVSVHAAEELAVRRYRAFFPTTGEVDVRHALAHAIASDRPSARAVGDGEKYKGPTAEAHVEDRVVETRNARTFRLKAGELNAVADGTVSAAARQTLRDLARTYERLADREDARIEPGAGATAS